MIKIAARLLCSTTALILILPAGTWTASAQTQPAPGASAPAPDPAFEAAKRAFEAMTEAERRAIQDALVWTGDFNGVVSGAFGRTTRAAIVAFARRSGLAVDGTLDPKGREALIAAGNLVKTRVGFAPARDPRTGAALGLPLKILVKRIDAATGSRWSAADNAVNLETMQSRESDGDLAALFDKLKDSTPTRRVTYKLLRPDFFVVSGEMGQTTFYTRMARGSANGAGVVRGYTLTYPASAKGNDRVSIAIANAFEPFAGAPAASPNAAAAQSTTLRPASPAPAVIALAPRASVVASSIAVSADRVVTVLARCTDPKVGTRAARIIKQDEASGLMLLEAQGLGARAILPGASAPAPNASILVLYQAAGSASLSAQVMASSGEALAPQANGKSSRVLAPLQEQAAGGAVFDRNGALAGLIGARTTPVRVAGIVPQAAWPLIEAPVLTAFLGANGMNVKSTPATEAPQSAADIATATRSALYPVICTQ